MATTRRTVDTRGIPAGRFQADQVPRHRPNRLQASIAEYAIAKQIRRLESQRDRAR